ncbi:MAG TPA: M23 family metallopeptidase [Solirubrobacteraceae bacterium]|nr:M23 family metallopeptidase [Solirubrobacteraceae bacterium]
MKIGLAGPAAAVATAASLAALVSAWLTPVATAIESTGGVAAPGAVLEAGSTSGTRGTGGTAFVAVSPKPRPVKKQPIKHKPARKPRKPSPPSAAPTPSGAPNPAQTVAQGAVFPVRGPHSFGGPENRFGAGRVGHIHQGQDVLASEGLEVLAPLSGTIITTGYQAGAAGWYVAEQAGDGLSFFYAHCQAGSVAVKAQQSVRAGQRLCLVGQTGDATGPHLHFEIWVGGWHVGNGYPVDPLPYLEAWGQ